MTPPEFPTFRKAILPNGLTLVTEQVPAVRSVALGVWVNAGSRDETAAESGMAHLVEHLLFKGTSNRSAARIAKEVDALGGHMDAFTGREHTCFFISVLDNRIGEGGDLLSDVFLNALFEEKDLDLERGVVLEEIKMCLDNPEDNLHDLTMAQVWGGNSLARPILGSPETVSAFKSADVRKFFAEHYHTGKAILTVVGNIDHDRVYELASAWFRNAPTGPLGTERVPPSFQRGRVREVKPLNQVYLDINLPGIAQTDTHRYPCHVLNTILGGSLSSRLFQKIREERGLVYSIFSGLSSHQDGGLLHISAGTSPHLSRQVVELIVAELALLKNKPPEPEEIRRAKDHLIGGLVLSMESTSNRMNKLGKQELYFGRHVTMEETIAEIEAVDAYSLEEAAAVLFRDGEISYGFLGPAEGLPADGDLPAW